MIATILAEKNNSFLGQGTSDFLRELGAGINWTNADDTLTCADSVEVGPVYIGDGSLTMDDNITIDIEFS